MKRKERVDRVRNRYSQVLYQEGQNGGNKEGDHYLKARLISEGVRVNWPDGPPQKINEVDLPKKIDGSDTKKVLELF